MKKKQDKKTAVVMVQAPPQSPSMLRSLSNPGQILEVGKILKEFIIKNGLSVVIDRKDYAYVDAWKFCGSQFGLTAICDEPVKISPAGANIHVTYANIQANGKNGKYTKEVAIYASTVALSDEDSKKLADKNKVTREIQKEYFAYKCGCKIIHMESGRTVQTGFATCSNIEFKKISFDEYAIASMAQTRCIGKAYRNLLGYVMNAAGVEATPAEEMEGTEIHSEPAKSGKPVMTPEQFAKTCKALETGKVTLDVVLKHYDFADGSNHENKLKVLDKKIKKHNEKSQPIPA